ncbi:unnamed protein product [Somion occarium]|uniref:GCM domain-containing protein n=1 Tax=Somion occarium TaxID=3059160 RepID=A0ABP1CTW0_9APHY
MFLVRRALNLIGLGPSSPTAPSGQDATTAPQGASPGVIQVQNPAGAIHPAVSNTIGPNMPMAWHMGYNPYAIPPMIPGVKTEPQESAAPGLSSQMANTAALPMVNAAGLPMATNAGVVPTAAAGSIHNPGFPFYPSAVTYPGIANAFLLPPGYPSYPPFAFAPGVPNPWLHSGMYPPPWPSTQPGAAPHITNTSIVKGDPLANETKQAVGLNQEVSQAAEGQPNENDTFDWPLGFIQREQPASLDAGDTKWRFTKWVWRSGGMCKHNGYNAEKRVCLGVVQCNACGRCQRPKTDVNARKVQLAKGCPGSGDGCNRMSLVWIKCTAQTWLFIRTNEDGVRIKVWEHDGSHNHPRPPGGALSVEEEAALDNQVACNPMASTHALRTGTIAPRSVPLHQISLGLANPRAARYQVQKSQARQGINPSSAKGGLALLGSLADLNQKLTSDYKFIVESSFSGPTYFVLQTPWMREVIKESVEDWIINSTAGADAGRHGFVTDGDHSFFRQGTLLATCAFSSTSNAWIPVLYSWISGMDMDHHRPHFRHLNHGIVKAAGPRFDKKFLLNVFDFSGSQRGAHADEFAITVSSMIPGWYLLTPEAQKAEHKALLKEALDYEVGCETHFWRSGTRLRQNPDLVPPSARDQFDNLRRCMVSVETTEEVFNELVVTFRATFPCIKTWMDWWMRPTVMGMIFPAKRTMNSTVASEVPHTSNPIETQHSLLHHASGKDQDLIPGIQNIFLHMQERENHHRAIKEGHFLSQAPRSHTTNLPRKEFALNDGRAPDTAEALHKEEQIFTPTPAVLPSLAIFNGIFPPSLQSRSMQGYQWYQNSCFIDVGLEVWFRSFIHWSNTTQEALLDALPTSPLISRIFNDFHQRLLWIQKLRSKGSEEADGLRILSGTQAFARNSIYSIWKLYPENSPGDTVEWMTHTLKDLDTKDNMGILQSYFAMQHLVIHKCPHGHQSTLSTPPVTVLRLRNDDTLLAIKNANIEQPTLEHYFD